MNNQSIGNQQSDVLELLEFEPFMDILDEVESFMPAMANITDENSRQNLTEILENDLERDEMVGSFELLVNIFENSSTIEDIASNVDNVYQQVMNTYEENIMSIFEKTKAFEKTARSLNLLYENAGGQAEVFLLPVNATKFADSTSPKHFEEMRRYLKQKFYAFVMEDSPFYITYIGDIGSKSAMSKMAETACETRALAILDTKEMNSVKAMIDHAKRLQIKGISANHAHLVVPGTWVYAAGAKDIQFLKDENGKVHRREKAMAIPVASAIIGRLLNSAPGVYITGLEADPIIGIDGVKLDYEFERLDSKALDKVGLVQIEKNGFITGSCTANNSSNSDLGKFAKVDTANALLKDLVQYCNNKAFSKWGENERRAFQREIEGYLNSRIKEGLIEGYTVNGISYDAEDENVNIDITANFFEVADEFDINLHGPKGAIDVNNKAA